MTNATSPGHSSTPGSRSQDAGVDLPRDGSGGRTSTTVGRRILADAVRAVDPAAADQIETTRDWRTGYLGAVRTATAVTRTSVDDEVAVARAGLASMRRQMVHVGDTDEVPLDQLSRRSATRLRVDGVDSHSARVRELAVPYRDTVLRGDALIEQVDDWVARGIAQPGVAEAIRRVVDRPDWLRLEGFAVAVIGAAGEMSPFRALASWGAHVLAIDLPSARVQDTISLIAQRGAGTTVVPIIPGGMPGSDLVAEALDLADWLHEQAQYRELVLGMYGYADRAMHVRLSAAFDLVRQRLNAVGRPVAVAGLATPTDAFVVPDGSVDAARHAWKHRGWRAVAQLPLRAVSGGRLLSPAYAAGDSVADVLVPQQGPNYALAKRIQRWVATDAAASGQLASFNVAPASWTRSVLKNRVLASAYAGADIFDIEVFEPETARTLMAALLVDDLNREGDRLTRPGNLFSDSAIHGGLWNRAYDPRSGLGLAAAIGLVRPGHGERRGRR